MKMALIPGSPPHTWRKQNDDFVNGASSGITSTYVEKTRTREVVNSLHEDHLHIRGEN